MTYRLVLVRHGRSEWNEKDLFTGWYDAELNDEGRAEAARAGRDLGEAGILPDLLHTSLQTRAIRTAQLALDEIGRLWIPVRRSWRLNERHYGALQGLNKAATKEQYGEEQFMAWRRSYDVPPPPLDADDERHARFDPRYASLPADVIPATECLKDVLVRMLPWWYDAIVPDLESGATVLVSAHGNSLRALVKHLEEIADDEITEVNIPTGVPLLYELDDAFAPATPGEGATPEARVLSRAVGDKEAARAAAAAVAAQGSSTGSGH